MFRTNQKLLFLLAGLFLATGLLTLTACTKKPPVVSDNGNNSNNTNNVSNNGNNTQSQNNNSNGVNDNGNNSQQDNNQQKPEKDPEEVVQEFYEWYIKERKKIMEDENLSFSVDTFFSRPEINENMVPDLIKEIKLPSHSDPILCAQNIPACLSVKLDKKTDEIASVIVHNYFSGEICQMNETWDRQVKVDMQLISNKWKISSILCIEN